ncbi:putative membrane protein [Lysinibacillus composti]|uniref:YhgE/Pip domain-containing protein n=1 Tax=Lysinibacillus composti TaxID=720633 RepID=A0A3N9UFD4_9BACI|nr:YhgE/Pip domain-containing protein [Lysinibacillus composti]MBM7608575.1 putative membrane protein [Lysinibacillus composti]RQW74858.1 YhgE/Pip domain-containing protein [Lysinibacillus composti]
MKTSWKIYLFDIKQITTNWVAAILIGGLILLPSLYAWLNIKASWNPYGQTDQIPIGIVNEDQGAVVQNEELHVGDQIVSSLKENKSMNWQFVEYKVAMKNLEYGDYFAVIIIPKDFSKKLGTVLNDEPQKAEIEYYVNEKINAIAPKITEKGASIIVQKISSQFISLVNGIIFSIFNDLGIKLEENLPAIERLEEYLFTLEKELPEIYQIVNQTIDDADRAEGLIQDAQQMIPRVEEDSTKGLQMIDETSEFLERIEQRVNNITPTINQDIDQLKTRLSELNEVLDNFDTNFSNGTQETDRIDSTVIDLFQLVDNITNNIQLLQQSTNINQNEDNTDNVILNDVLMKLSDIKNALQNITEQSTQLDSIINNRQPELNEKIAMLQENRKEANEQIEKFLNSFTELQPVLKNKVTEVKNTLASAKSILTQVQQTIPEVSKMLNRTETNLLKGREVLATLSSDYPIIRDKIIGLTNQIRFIQKDTDLSEIIKLLQNNPIAEEQFFKEPVLLNEHKMFPIANYGTGMTPFYTVLATWVGGLLLISLLSTEVHPNENYSRRQIYFGRMFTFITIGILQAVIVSLGNIWLLKVDIIEPFWFILFCILCSCVFIIIVYTLVSVFGNVGKALSIVLLVLQIAGSGGTYPAVLLPTFFQLINPFLPFTYAIDLLREATAGRVLGRVYHDILFILVFGVIALMIGFLKGPINKFTERLRNKGKQSGLFH